MSIIVPVYNIQAYVGRCIDSLIGQTYKNIEIIAVDDGSTDGSGDIVDDYKNKDSRIRVIHKTNGGLSSARNAGLDICEGEFVLYVDGDDWLDCDAVQLLVEEINKTEADLVMFPYVREYTNKSLKSLLFDEGSRIFSADEVANYLLPYLIGPGKNQKLYNPLLMDRMNTAWGKLYRTNCIRDFRFLNTQLIGVEDGFYNIQVFINTALSKGKISYTETTCYHYEKGNSTSLVHSYRPKYFEKREMFYRKTKDTLLKSHREDLLDNLRNRIVLELFGETANLVYAPAQARRKSKYLREKLGQDYYKEAFDQFQFNKLNPIWKVYFGMFKYKITMVALAVTKVMLTAKG